MGSAIFLLKVNPLYVFFLVWPFNKDIFYNNVDVIKFFVQSMFSLWVTPWFSVSYPNLFQYVFFIMYLRPYRRTYSFILTAKLNSETVFFFVLNWSLSLSLNFSMSYQIDRVIVSEHLVKCIFSWLSPRHMILLGCFDIFVQNVLFYIKETDLSIFLEFPKLPYCDLLYCTTL